MELMTNNLLTPPLLEINKDWINLLIVVPKYLSHKTAIFPFKKKKHCLRRRMYGHHPEDVERHGASIRPIPLGRRPQQCANQ